MKCAHKRSHAHLVFELRDFLLGLHDQLLEARLVLFLFNQLLLKMVVLLPLRRDLVRQLLKVRHNKWVDNFDVLVILSGEVIFHQADLLPQQIDLFLVVAHLLLRRLNNVGDCLDVGFDVVAVGGSGAWR